ncbi:MAG: hypothetical protein JWO56_1373 [Acidobacteria bacterium]|nr:hypothetical protein [Acidobacteriota bacterium]
MSTDHYRTLAAAAEHRQKIERSDFLALAFPIATDEELFAELERIQKRYFDATHHCWAFRLFDGRQRSSDAGEPSGTAGKPILSAIEGASLYDVGLVVVRWYGGVKLGTGGLGRADRDTAALALREAPTLDRYVYERVRVTVPFSALSTVYRLVSPPDVVLVGEHFGETNVYEFDVRASRVEGFWKVLAEKRLV